MHILLCAATSFEIEPTFPFIHSTIMAPHRVDVLITGVGLLPAAFHITRQATVQQPQLLLQAGVAGSLDDTLSLGETVIVASEQVGDAGVLQNGTFSTLFDMGLAQKNTPPWTEGKLVNHHNDIMQLTGLKSVSGLTVNEITTHSDRIDLYRQYGAQAESLEGAALHYTGIMTGIPFLQLRSLSNVVGERDKKEWRMKEAIENLNKELQNILVKLTQL